MPPKIIYFIIYLFITLQPDVFRHILIYAFVVGSFHIVLIIQYLFILVFIYYATFKVLGQNRTTSNENRFYYSMDKCGRSRVTAKSAHDLMANILDLYFVFGRW